ncbi:MAG: protease modulator HflK [Verrucomicrobia bacterium]|nr:protease modulator HflK [Verrucomicrobiota bacterium]
MVRITTPEPTVEVDEQETTLSASDLAHLHRALLWLVILFAGSAATGLLINLPTPLFAGMQFYLSWCAIAALIQYLFLRIDAADLSARDSNGATAPRSQKPSGSGRAEPFRVSEAKLESFASTGQWVIFFLGTTGATVFFRATMGTAGLDRDAAVSLRVATVVFLAAGCAFYFFGNFAKAVAGRVGSDALSAILTLARIASLAAFAAAGLIFLFLSTARDYSAWLGWILIAFTAFLITETLIRFALRFYQPKSLRKLPGPAGNSLLLDALFGRGHGLGSAVKGFEDLLGVKLREVWIVRYLRQTLELIFIGTIVLGWLSTCFTSVPAGSRAVRMLFGRYQPVALLPGLHVTWPWPVEQLEIVETETIRQISLGFDKDLSGPVLWNEPHFEGEKNLLVGDGESLLTINVPIFYRISNPVRYLETTTNAEQALLVLAERKLIQVAGSRDSFRIMTQQRAEIARQLRESLQREVDQFGLGLEIVFVGLKDVHPPVDVAPAYQEVISAQEEKDRTIDLARASRVKVLPEAQAEANRIRVEEEAAYRERVATAQGSTARFSAIIQADRENSAVFRFRLKLDVIEQVMGKANKTILAMPAQINQGLYLDLRDTNDLPPP